MMKDRFQYVMCLCLLGLTLPGCFGRDYSGPRRYPLSGKVTYDGEPIDTGTITFLPQSGDEDRVSGGSITNGVYSVPEAQGANEGTYRVEIRWAKKTGKQYYNPELEMMVDIRKEGLPPRFHRDSELVVEVSEDNTVFDFDLKSDAGPAR